MKKLITSILIIALSINSAISADYDYIDRGDYYYIYNFGEDDDYVVVVRKLGESKVKVRDLDTGGTKVVYASELLTKSEVEAQGTKTKIGLGALAICLFGGCSE